MWHTFPLKFKLLVLFHFQYKDECLNRLNDNDEFIFYKFFMVTYGLSKYALECHNYKCTILFWDTLQSTKPIFRSNMFY